MMLHHTAESLGGIGAFCVFETVQRANVQGGIAFSSAM
jgi:hypothetical protein